MADSKVWEQKLQLTASLNSGFQTAFSKAQQEFVRLGKEIQSLNRIQSDVSSYQKQLTAIQNTTTKLENLQQQQAKLSQQKGYLDEQIKETKNAGESTAELNRQKAALEQQELKLEQQIKNTSSALETQNQKLNATGERLQNAGVDTDHLTEESEKLTEQIKDLANQQSEAADSAEEFSDRASQSFEAVQNAIAAAGITTALKEIMDGFMECASVAGDFEESMSNVAALSGASGAELDALTDKAKELGAATKFTAQESADAMGYMAMAGWSAEDMIVGMDGVLSLASASGEDLATTSDIVTDALTAFGMTASDTNRFVDILAQASTKSNTTVSMLGESFKYVAPLCGALGFSAEDAAVALGLMANSGIKGSQAGTALKTALANLSSPTENQAIAMEQLGISLTDTSGEMYTLQDIVVQMRSAFSNLSEAQQAEAATTIFGKEAMSGMLSIINASEADFNSLTNSIRDSAGAAQQMADIKLDNMNGQLTLLQSAWDGLKITVGEQFTPTLQDLYGVGADVLTQVNDFVAENPALVKTIASLVTGLGAVAAGITGVSAAMKVVQALKIGSIFTGPVGAIAGVAAGVVAVTTAVTAFKSAAEESLDESWELTASSREQYEQLQKLNAEYENAVSLYGETSYEAQSLKWRIDDLSASYENSKQTFEEYKAAHESVMDSYREVADSSGEAYDSLDTETASVAALVNKLGELTSSSENAAANQDAVRAIVDELNTSLPELNLSYEEAFSGSNNFVDRIKEMAQAEAESKRLAQDYQNYVDRLSQKGALDKEKDDAAEQVRLAQEDYEIAMRNYQKAREGFENDPTGITAAFSTMGESAAVDAAREQLEYCKAALDEVTIAAEENEAAIAAAEEGFRAYQQTMEDTTNTAPSLDGVLDSVRTTLENLSLAYQQAYDAAYESIHGQYSLWDEAAEVTAVSAGSINEALESQTRYWEDYNTNLSNLSSRAAEIDGLSDVIASFADGSSDSVNAIAGMAGATDEQLRDMVENWRNLQNQQDETSQNLAELVSGFPEQMAELQTAMQEGIAGMEMPDEAKESAKNTIQAFIDEANGQMLAVQNAYANLGRIAVNSLGLNAGSSNNLSSSGYAKTGGASSTASTSKRLGGASRGFASGTNYAPPGWFWVGENGRELMRLHGGETILSNPVSENVSNAYAAYAQYTDEYGGSVLHNTYSNYKNFSDSSYAETFNAVERVPSSGKTAVSAEAIPRLFDGGDPSIQITAPITINVQGNAAQDTVDSLRASAGEISDSIVEKVLRELRQEMVDARRGSYRGGW